MKKSYLIRDDYGYSWNWNGEMKKLFILLLTVLLCGCVDEPGFGPEVTISETITYYKACVTPENPGCITICTWVDINGNKAPFEIFTGTPIEPEPNLVEKNMTALLKGDS